MLLLLQLLAHCLRLLQMQTLASQRSSTAAVALASQELHLACITVTTVITLMLSMPRCKGAALLLVELGAVAALLAAAAAAAATRACST
jgi:hypothetical protein